VAYPANALFDAHRDDPEFGCLYLADEARDSSYSPQPHGSRRDKNGKKAGPPVYGDLLERNFTADALNRLRLADISETPHRRGRALPVCDHLAVDALDCAGTRRAEAAGCILHTDRGGGFYRRLHHFLDHGDRVVVDSTCEEGASPF
jgi:putative transposase